MSTWMEWGGVLSYSTLLSSTDCNLATKSERYCKNSNTALYFCLQFPH